MVWLRETSDKSDEFSMLDGDDGSAYPPHILKMGHCWRTLKIDCTIRVFRSFGAWITHSRTPQKYRVANHFHINLNTNFQGSLE